MATPAGGSSPTPTPEDRPGQARDKEVGSRPFPLAQEAPQCPHRPGPRTSQKQAANRPTRPMARSAAPSSSGPAFRLYLLTTPVTPRAPPAPCGTPCRPPRSCEAPSRACAPAPGVSGIRGRPDAAAGARRVWAAEYRRELLGFPGGRHNDQVDSTTRFLIWAEERPEPRPPIRSGSWPSPTRGARPRSGATRRTALTGPDKDQDSRPPCGRRPSGRRRSRLAWRSAADARWEMVRDWSQPVLREPAPGRIGRPWRTRQRTSTSSTLWMMPLLQAMSPWMLRLLRLHPEREATRSRAEGDLPALRRRDIDRGAVAGPQLLAAAELRRGMAAIEDVRIHRRRRRDRVHHLPALPRAALGKQPLRKVRRMARDGLVRRNEDGEGAGGAEALRDAGALQRRGGPGELRVAGDHVHATRRLRRRPGSAHDGKREP